MNSTNTKLICVSFKKSWQVYIDMEEYDNALSDLTQALNRRIVQEFKALVHAKKV